MLFVLFTTSISRKHFKGYNELQGSKTVRLYCTITSHLYCTNGVSRWNNGVQHTKTVTTQYKCATEDKQLGEGLHSFTFYFLLSRQCGKVLGMLWLLMELLKWTVFCMGKISPISSSFPYYNRVGQPLFTDKPCAFF